MQDRPFAAIMAIAGVIIGFLVWLLTVLTTHLHISGKSWSLSGNGALIIPFGLVPALVAAGWAAIVLRMRGHPRWAQLAVGSGLVGLVLLGGSLLSIVAFGANRDTGATASVFFGFLLYLWLLGSPITAAMIPAPDPSRKAPPIWPMASILLLPVTLIAGCTAGSGLLPS
jgi:hypothetical protein